jgi:outer membrane immunogenic protein
VPLNWAGFYAGVNGGYGWTNTNSNVAVAVDGFGGFFNGPAGTYTANGGAQPEGGFGGGQFGYNWQRDRFVFGIETDIQGAGLTDKKNLTFSDTAFVGPGFGPSTGVENREIDWFGTLRGRLGYSFDRTLIYFTGGLAYGGVKEQLVVSNPFNPGTLDLNGDNTRAGYVLGGGVEYKVSPAWSIKGEYQDINLGSQTLSGINTGFFTDHNTTNARDYNFSTVRVGVNYHVLPVYEPLK